MLKVGFILGFFGKRVSTAQKKYREFVEKKIGREEKSPLKDVACSTILGSMEFVKAVSKKHLGDKRANREMPALRKLSGQISIAEIEKIAEEVFRKEEKTGKKVSVYLSHRYSGMKIKEIGEHFGISESGVTQASRRLEKKIDEDKKLKRRR